MCAHLSLSPCLFVGVATLPGGVEDVGDRVGEGRVPPTRGLPNGEPAARSSSELA